MRDQDRAEQPRRTRSADEPDREPRGNPLCEAVWTHQKLSDGEAQPVAAGLQAIERAKRSRRDLSICGSTRLQCREWALLSMRQRYPAGKIPSQRAVAGELHAPYIRMPRPRTTVPDSGPLPARTPWHP